jgi:hypothetical protein
MYDALVQRASEITEGLDKRVEIYFSGYGGLEPKIYQGGFHLITEDSDVRVFRRTFANQDRCWVAKKDDSTIIVGEDWGKITFARKFSFVGNTTEYLGGEVYHSPGDGRVLPVTAYIVHTAHYDPVVADWWEPHFADDYHIYAVVDVYGDTLINV